MIGEVHTYVSSKEIGKEVPSIVSLISWNFIFKLIQPNKNMQKYIPIWIVLSYFSQFSFP